jgi:hypothetical protein
MGVCSFLHRFATSELTGVNSRKIPKPSPLASLPSEAPEVTIGYGCSSSREESGHANAAVQSSGTVLPQLHNSGNGMLHQPTNKPSEALIRNECIISEGGADIQTCREIAMGLKIPRPDKLTELSTPGREEVEYHTGRYFVSKLGELLAHQRARRLTRIIIRDEEPIPNQPNKQGHDDITKNPETFGLDAADIRFLQQKGAFTLPPDPHWQVNTSSSFLLCCFIVSHCTRL